MTVQYELGERGVLTPYVVRGDDRRAVRACSLKVIEGQPRIKRRREALETVK